MNGTDQGSESSQSSRSSPTDLVDAGYSVPIPRSIVAKSPQIVTQGAEAIVLRTEGPEIVKYRPPKPWRLAELDQRLRRKRTVSESRVLSRLASFGIIVPHLISVDEHLGLIIMENIDGVSLKQATWDLGADAVVPFYEQLGAAIARMHSLNIVHGDLTTSNAMVRDDEVVLIDFGLSGLNASIEDKAVDLYVLERAVESTHPLEASTLMKDTLMPSYEATAHEVHDGKIVDVLERLRTVRMRGRKRTQLG